MMRYLPAIFVLTITVAPPCRAETSPPGSSGIESLGTELLQDLKPSAFDDSDENASPGSDDSHTEPYGKATRAPRFNDLGDDIGQPSGALSLVRVRDDMQQAQILLGDKKSTDAPSLKRAGEAQQQVITQLDKLIAELSKQCNCNKSQPSAAPPKPGQKSQKKPGKPQNAVAKGQRAARDSNNRLGSASAKAADKADRQAMAKNLWGHLPQRSREQMMQSFSEDFLPKYEFDIEQYYRRLGEDDDRQTP